MYIPQRQLANLKEAVRPGKVVVIYGPHRVGKTTLLKKYLESIHEEVLFVNGDDIVIRQYLESQSIEKLRDFVGNHSLLLVDEAQYISQELTRIRRFARMNGVHVWIVAHPRNLVKDKDGNYRAPTMYEISGGAHWRNKADAGICLHRPDYKRAETEVIIQKTRFREIGRLGKVELRFAQETGRYL